MTTISTDELVVQNPQARALPWVLRQDNALRALAVLAYVVLVLLGATTSSIGMPTLREDPQAPLGLQIGPSSQIRADEYNAFSPIVLSIMATGGDPSTSPLAAPAGLVHRYPSGGFFESVVFFDSTMLRSAAFLPDAMVFAAHWWLPALLLFLFLPTWFAQLGAARRWGWLAAALIALAPASSWWTMMPIQLIAYTVAGSSLLLKAYTNFGRGRRAVPVLQSLASGILLAGMPSFYIPWSIVLGLPVLTASVAWVFAARGPWRPKLLALGSAGLCTVVFAAGTLWENRSGMAALLDTVYPGSRRSGGTAIDFGMLFGAPSLGAMRDMAPIGSNQSELSTAYTVTFLWAAVLLIGLVSIRPIRNNIAILVMSAFGLVWLAWCTVNFGALGPLLPVLNYVQPARAAQVCGIIGTILLCLLLARLKGTTGWKIPLLAALGCGLVSAYAASQLQQSYLPNIRPWSIAAVAIAVGVAVLCLTRFHDRIWPMALVTALAVLPVLNTNPLLFGLGDLRESATATYLREQGRAAREAGQVWASDSPWFDNVAFSNGVPSLSGLQRSGPNKAEWARLDPDGSHEQDWNRGGGFIYFQWLSEPGLNFGNTGFDVTFVRVDPCELKARVPNLAGIASTRPLTQPCLTPDRTLQWSGSQMFIYKVS